MSQITVLVVDDEENIRHLVGSALRRAGASAARSETPTSAKGPTSLACRLFPWAGRP